MNNEVLNLFDQSMDLRYKLSRLIIANIDTYKDVKSISDGLSEEYGLVRNKIDLLCNDDKGLVNLYHSLWLSLREEDYIKSEEIKNKIDSY